MQEQEFINIPKAELDALKERIQQLEQEVQKLRFESLYARDMNHGNGSSLFLRPKFDKNTSDQYKRKRGSRLTTTMSNSPHILKEEWEEWSKKLKVNTKNQQQKVQQKPPSSESVQYEDQQLPQLPGIDVVLTSHPGLIEQICLFGPSSEQLMSSSQRVYTAPFQMYYPQESQKEDYRVYGNYLFPDQVSVKRVRDQKKSTEINRIVFKKSLKRQDISVLILMGQENHPMLQPSYHNQLLQYCNPGKKLYAFSINFTDFISTGAGQSPHIVNMTASNAAQSEMTFETTIDFNATTGMGNISLNDIRQQTKNKVFLSKFCITIFTYFPLVRLIERLLLKIMEQIKIKRLQTFTNKKSTTNDIDVKLVIRELSEISEKLMKQGQSFYPQLGNTGTFAVGHEMIQVVLRKEQINEEMYGGWVYEMLKPLNKQLAYQILSHIVFQESICFICEDLHFLTFFILLFTDFLLRPLIYPYKHVSVMFNEELLGAPIIVVMGINKNQKWLLENLSNIGDSKVIVNLNQEVSIRCKKKQKTYKSQRLRKSLGNFYKKMEAHQPIIFGPKKREISIKPSTPEEQQLVLWLSGEFYSFFEDEILFHLPNPAIISHMKKQMESGNHTVQASNIIKQVEKYFKESRRQKEKDAFIQFLSKHQIFYLLITIRYGII